MTKQCDNDKEKIREFIKSERERYLRNLEQFEMNEIQKIEKRQKYYTQALETFMRREYETTNKKTLKLPNGTLAIKKQQIHYEYMDEEIITWAEMYYPELVKTTIPEPKKSIDKKELKKLAIVDNGTVIIDGMVVQGVYAEERPDKFDLK